MLIDTRINRDTFVHNEIIRGNFSYEGANVLYDWFQDDEYNTVEFDPVAIRCEYSEATFKEIKEYYSNLEPIKNANTFEELLEVLNEYTIVAGVSEKNTIVYLQF
tara:strand:+ start:298 stop:612 length:315 start_codon:yes stop_codon:yes gene_type:complete